MGTKRENEKAGTSEAWRAAATRTGSRDAGTADRRPGSALSCLRRAASGRTVVAVVRRAGDREAGWRPPHPASSGESAELGRLVQEAVRGLKGLHGLRWARRIPGEELAALLGVSGTGRPPRIAGVEPDGGVWRAEGEGLPLAAVEAKTQGEGGNAIERWFKNWSVLSRLGVRVYVTFCSGPGFFDGNKAQRIMELAAALEPSERSKLPDRVWNNPEGRLWLYRYRSASEAVDVQEVMSMALSKAVRDAASGRRPDAS